MLYIEKNPRNLSPGFDVTGTTEANTSAILHKRGLESTHHRTPCLPTTGAHAYPPQDPMLTHQNASSFLTDLVDQLRSFMEVVPEAGVNLIVVERVLQDPVLDREQPATNHCCQSLVATSHT